ncbi:MULTISPECIES: lysozyme inhibitor LprI family protein [Lysobacter]|uniref:Lysozyme inhibitor LprI family protein n=1 Tax=Lysobacter firmicutimachus TaxID=1792846 RepID=A0ABU8D9Y7_9GAMM|nr:lysozyme inhibitor LprI family protein [Lysobacter antibioticus]
MQQATVRTGSGRDILRGAGGRRWGAAIALILAVVLVPGAYAEEESQNSAAADRDPDCIGIGDTRQREACFARWPDSRIAECERMRLSACAPYRDMHRLEARRLSVARSLMNLLRAKYASYVENDPAYVDDLSAYLRADEQAWAAARDAACALDPFVQGMARREAPGLTEACRVERTRERVEALEARKAALLRAAGVE